MTAKERAQQDWKLQRAVVLVRETPRGKQYRISSRELMYEGDVPMDGFLSNWCNSEERAWHAALCRRWHKTYSRESW